MLQLNFRISEVFQGANCVQAYSSLGIRVLKVNAKSNRHIVSVSPDQEKTRSCGFSSVGNKGPSLLQRLRLIMGPVT